MGFVLGSLGPTDQADVLRLSPEIIRTIRKASAAARERKADVESKRWFGDTSAAWMSELSWKLDRFASLINLQPIEIIFRPLKRRTPYAGAAAAMPRCGWKDMTSGADFMARAQEQSYSIELDNRWNRVPMNGMPQRPNANRFHVLVHECSHLFLHTEDYVYGSTDCDTMAFYRPSFAKDNADNWAFFVDEFR